jgi:hypothetical protein
VGIKPTFSGHPVHSLVIKLAEVPGLLLSYNTYTLFATRGMQVSTRIIKRESIELSSQHGATYSHHNYIARVVQHIGDSMNEYHTFNAICSVSM